VIPDDYPINYFFIAITGNGNERSSHQNACSHLAHYENVFIIIDTTDHHNMRFNLLSLACVVAIAAATRRGPATVTKQKVPKAGWGMDGKVSKVKEVKKVNHLPKTGWLGLKVDTEKDVIDQMDGFE